MNATCRLCNQHAALADKILTDHGQVTVTVCMICDRSRCRTCQRSLPGNVGYCYQCGTPIRQPAK